MKLYEFASFEEYEESEQAHGREAVTVVKEYGWLNTDLMTECKSYKTALKRFFSALSKYDVLSEWYECLMECCENGCFRDNDSRMASGKMNEYPCYAWEVQKIDENGWYVFLNLRYEAFLEQPCTADMI